MHLQKGAASNAVHSSKADRYLLAVGAFCFLEGGAIDLTADAADCLLGCGVIDLRRPKRSIS